MTKKYTYHKVRLLITLFTLHTFFSCMASNRSLGINRQEQNDLFAQRERNVGDCLIKFVPIGIGVLWVIVCPIWILSLKNRLPNMPMAKANISRLNRTITSKPIQKLVDHNTIPEEQLNEWNQTLNLALAHFNSSNAALL